MERKIEKIIIGIIVLLFGIIIFPNFVNAASVTVSASASSVEVGKTVTITVGSDCIGRVDLSISGPGTLSTNKAWIEGSSQQVTVTTTGEGKITVTATPSNPMSYNNSPVNVGATSCSFTAKTASSNNSGTNNGGNSSNSNNTSTEKSNVTTLKNLGIKPNDFSGFKAGTLQYNVSVPNEVESIEVYAYKGQEGQTISGTGKKNLTEGKNTYNVVVTAANGKDKRTYTINITREAKKEENSEQNPEEKSEEKKEEENPGDGIESVFGLENLKIQGITLEPEFKTDIYEYQVNYIGNLEKFEIEANSTEANTKIEITGNEELKEGENTITILVTNETGEKTATYQITVNKSLEDKQALAKEQEQEKQKLEKTRKIIILGAGVVVVIVVLIAIILIRRRNKNNEEEYTIPYAGLNKDETELEEDKEQQNKTQEPEDKKEYRDIREEFLSQENQIPYEEEEEIQNKKKHGKGKRFK